MTQDTADSDRRTDSRLSRRQWLTAIAASGSLAVLGSAAAQDTEPARDLTVGGGPMSDAMSGALAKLYRGPTSKLDDAGVEGRYFQVTIDDANLGYQAGDLLEDTGDEWQVLDIGFGAVDTDVLTNTDYNETVETHPSASGTVTIDIAAANVHHVEATGNVTFEFSGVTDNVGNSLLLYCLDDDAGGPYSLAWPDSVVWADGAAVTEIPADSDVEVSLLSGDGSQWRGRKSGGDFA